jgi:2-keto-3-deoxy-L-rhamnonate aldolase RhmA
MNLKTSCVKKRLQEGKVCFGTMLRVLKSPQAIALCAGQGWDYVIMDTEHNDYDYQTLASCMLLAKYEQMDAFVRVPDKLYHQMAQMLDIGAEGLVLPQVKTREEARHIVRSTKYAPVGQRGVSISNTVTRFRDYDMETYTQWANRELMTIVMIESEEGVDNVDSIVSTPGVDAVMMGPSDLSQDMGISGQIHHRKMEQAFDKVVEYCNRHDVAPGIHVNKIEDVSKAIDRGMRFITYNYDINLFKEASQNALWELRSLVAHD